VGLSPFHRFPRVIFLFVGRRRGGFVARWRAAARVAPDNGVEAPLQLEGVPDGDSGDFGGLGRVAVVSGPAQGNGDHPVHVDQHHRNPDPDGKGGEGRGEEDAASDATDDNQVPLVTPPLLTLLQLRQSFSRHPERKADDDGGNGNPGNQRYANGSTNQEAQLPQNFLLAAPRLLAPKRAARWTQIMQIGDFLQA